MICSNCESTEFTCGGCGVNLQPADAYTAAEVKVLTETASKVAMGLALEDAAKIADDLAEGVANPEKPYNDAFIHACNVVARHIREAQKAL